MEQMATTKITKGALEGALGVELPDNCEIDLEIAEMDGKSNKPLKARISIAKGEATGVTRLVPMITTAAGRFLGQDWPGP